MLTAQIHYKHNSNGHIDILHVAVRKPKLNPSHTTPRMDTATAGSKKRNHNL